MLMPVTAAAVAGAGMTKNDIGFTCSGSTDYLAGSAFSFVSTLDGVGPWPPIQESHVEMDGAWALYEAWVKLQLGEIDTALIYSYGKSSPGPTHEVQSRQLDPYFVAPLWPDTISLSALQARALLESGKATEKDFADVVARSRKAALDNPHAQLKWDKPADQVLAEAMLVDPLRKDDCPPITDGVAAVVIAAGDVARAHCDARRGSAASTIASSRRCSGCATSPTRRRPAPRGEGGRGTGLGRRRRAAHAVQLPGADHPRGARPRRRRRHQSVGRRAVRQPDHGGRARALR